MPKNNIVIGIDLGTTYSSVAYVNSHGKPEVIPNREGEYITPSVVLFDDDSPMVGTLAKRSAVGCPLNFCEFVKRQMGEKEWRFIAEDDQTYSAEEVSGILLSRLKEDAETFLQCEIKDAVITVPAYFNDAQRKATQDAGVIAGLNVRRIVNEPTAAALAYGLSKVDDNQTVMVYDLGGGTFDVTFLRINKEKIDVIATGGDKNLGGFDWDNCIMDYLNEAFLEKGGTDLFDDPSTTQDLRDKAEIAKKTLSSRDKTKIFVSASGKTETIELSRTKFEEISENLLNRTKSLMEMTLEDANLEWSQVDKILLVGGSTRMPAVTVLIESVYGKKPSSELHPDEVVAHGAAILATMMMAEDRDEASPGLPNISITDVNSHSLGVVAVHSSTNQPYNSIVLPKDTPIPTKVGNFYVTMVDNQTRLQIEITEGEEESLEFVKVIGCGEMSIPPYPKGAPIEVVFQYSNDGIVFAEVFDRTSDKSVGELKITREANLTQDQLESMRQRIGTTEIQ